MPSAPSSTGTTMQATPRQAGQNRRWRSSSVDALRHGSTGAMAISVRRARPSGVVMRSKNGRPTDSRRSCSASTTSGNTVPSSTTKAKSEKSRLLARNAPSRESGESIDPGDRSRSPRQPISATEVPAARAKKASRYAPSGPSENAWTLSMTPLRVRNVPRMVRQNVAQSSDRFQTRSIPRRSWTRTEWMNAVAVSQGRRLAFSTGSHPQTPPQPRTS